MYPEKSDDFFTRNVPEFSSYQDIEIMIKNDDHTDPDSNIHNLSWCRQSFNNQKSEKRFENIIIEKDRDNVIKTLKNALLDQNPYDIEYRIIKQPPTQLWSWEGGLHRGHYGSFPTPNSRYKDELVEMQKKNIIIGVWKSIVGYYNFCFFNLLRTRKFF